MKGKTIENITADKIGDFGARQIDLYFTDGTSESFVSSILHDGNEEWNAESEIQFLN